MNQQLAQITLIVNDYDEAIKFYIGKLNFEVSEDTILTESKRWVVIKSKGSNGCKLLLAKATDIEQKSRIGNQTGGRVFLFFYTDDIERDYINMKQKEIIFVRDIIKEKWGKVAVFQDLYGNLCDLIEPLKA